MDKNPSIDFSVNLDQPEDVTRRVQEEEGEWVTQTIYSGQIVTSRKHYQYFL